MADILLTHSYFLRFDPKQERSKTPYPPLGTLYAAACLQKESISTALFDTMLADSEEELHHSITAHRSKVLVIYDDDFNYLNKMCLTRMREAAFRMSAIAKEYDLPVIVHGSDAVDHAEKYLSHGADLVVIGEGEQTLLEACRTILAGTSRQWNAINGIAFQSNGELIRTKKRPVVQSLDLLPFPAWELIEWEKYRSVWKKYHGYFSVNMVTTRGCPYHCNWCAKPIYGQVYNSRSPENVVEEMLHLRKIAQPDHIWFADDIFGLKPGWVQRFAECVNQRNVKIPFKIQSRADLLVKGNTVEALASAGCDEAWIGAESGSQKILDAMEKGITVQQIREARELLRQHGIRASFFLQFGYSGETFGDIRATVSMMKDLMPDNIGISVSYPLPGTKFYENVKSGLGEKKNWTDSDDLALMYHGMFSPKFYKILHRYVHKIFRSRQGLTYLKDLFVSAHPVSLQKIRRVILLAYYFPAIVIDKMRLYQHSKQ